MVSDRIVTQALNPTLLEAPGEGRQTRSGARAIKPLPAVPSLALGRAKTLPACQSMLPRTKPSTRGASGGDQNPQDSLLQPGNRPEASQPAKRAQTAKGTRGLLNEGLSLGQEMASRSGSAVRRAASASGARKRKVAAEGEPTGVAQMASEAPRPLKPTLRAPGSRPQHKAVRFALDSEPEVLTEFFWPNGPDGPRMKRTRVIPPAPTPNTGRAPSTAGSTSTARNLEAGGVAAVLEAEVAIPRPKAEASSARRMLPKRGTKRSASEWLEAGPLQGPIPEVGAAAIAQVELGQSFNGAQAAAVLRRQPARESKALVDLPGPSRLLGTSNQGLLVPSGTTASSTLRRQPPRGAKTKLSTLQPAEPIRTPLVPWKEGAETRTGMLPAAAVPKARSNSQPPWEGPGPCPKGIAVQAPAPTVSRRSARIAAAPTRASGPERVPAAAAQAAVAAGGHSPESISAPARKLGSQKVPAVAVRGGGKRHDGAPAIAPITALFTPPAPLALTGAPPAAPTGPQGLAGDQPSGFHRAVEDYRKVLLPMATGDEDVLLREPDLEPGKDLEATSSDDEWVEPGTRPPRPQEAVLEFCFVLTQRPSPIVQW